LDETVAELETPEAMPEDSTTLIMLVLVDLPLDAFLATFCLASPDAFRISDDVSTGLGATSGVIVLSVGFTILCVPHPSNTRLARTAAVIQAFPDFMRK